MDADLTTTYSDSSDAPTIGDVTSKKSCPICQAIPYAFLAKKTVSLGTWQGYLDREECACCQLIVRRLRRCNQYQLALEPSCQLRFREVIDSFWLESDYTIDIHSKNQVTTDHPFIELVPKHVPGQYVPGQRILDYLPIHPTQIDIARLRKWPEYCDQNHRQSCHSLPHWQMILPASSLILVDVYDNCLVHFPNRMSHPYVALSYVWGQLSGTIELKRKTYSRLLLKGSLRIPENVICIPKTILDAITLTHAMGLRYLWVDRLCIIQDEPTHLTEQLQQMSSIYANSYFTIIAADGTDANYGLRGVACNTSPREYKPTMFKFSENFSMLERPRAEKVNETFWHTRGWTFQERALSPRNLVFTQNTVYWQCRKTVWHESVIGEPDGICLTRSKFSQEEMLLGFPFNALKTSPWPDIYQYFTLVRGYNSRNLTFENDALRAFSAVTAAMTKFFPGGFHFGLPVFLFDVAMLWAPWGSSSRRRSFPSWSWLGWKAEVLLPIGYSESWKPRDSSFSHFEVEMNPLVRWAQRI